MSTAAYFIRDTVTRQIKDTRLVWRELSLALSLTAGRTLHEAKARGARDFQELIGEIEILAESLESTAKLWRKEAQALAQRDAEEGD